MVNTAKAPLGILIFAKAPEAGKVKTRMQPDFTPEESAKLQENLIAHTINTALQTKAPVELWCAPSADHPYFQKMHEDRGISLYVQTEGTLGDKMRTAMNNALVRYEHVLLIGTDCPLMTNAMLNNAANQLHTHDCTFIPALDGGYVLVGARNQAPPCFENIAWGSDTVMKSTLDALNRVNYSYALNNPTHDLDYYADWLALPHHLQETLAPLKRH